VDYASEHFKCEEKLLRDHTHPDLAQQKIKHREFRRQAGEFCLLASKQNEQVTHDLSDYLHNWWIHHILHEDKKYAALLGDKAKNRQLNGGIQMD
jgi:hemerythrin-like metal-binding protein